LQKLDVKEVISTLLSFDIFALNETFVYFDTFSHALFNDYDVFVSKAVKLSQRGRHSGGVMVFVRKYLSGFVRRIDMRYEHVIVLEIDKQVMGADKNVLLICLYVHPHDSKYWSQSQNGFGLEVLEQCLLDLYERFEDFYVVICGDLNARTGCMNAIVKDEWVDENDYIQYYMTEQDDFIFKRQSDDKEMNTFGKELLNVCETFDCVIANGVSYLKFDNSFTFVSSNGSSVIDYFIVSSDLCWQQRIGSLRVLPCIDSSHSPVCISIKTLQCDENSSTENKHNKHTRTGTWINKRIWNAQLEQHFIDKTHADEITDMHTRALQLLDFDVDHALELFTKALVDCSECMVKRIYVGNDMKDPLWFDAECRQLKNKARHSLSLFRKTKQPDDRRKYVEDRKQYKTLIKQKKIKLQA